MYNDYINEKIDEKRDYDISLFKEYLIIYINLIFKFYTHDDIRKELTKFLINYFKYSKLEYELLFYIKKLKSDSKIEDECIEILDELENIFEKEFQYNELVLDGYQEAIFYDDITRAIVMKKRFETLNIDKKNEYIKRLK